MERPASYLGGEIPTRLGSARVGQGRLVLPSAARAALSSITRLAWTMDSYLYFNRRIPLCGQTFACCIDQRHATQALP